jgi:hypothetical protein
MSSLWQHRRAWHRATGGRLQASARCGSGGAHGRTPGVCTKILLWRPGRGRFGPKRPALLLAQRSLTCNPLKRGNAIGP